MFNSSNPIAPSHGENRGSSPLGSAITLLFALIPLSFLAFSPNRTSRVWALCSGCVLKLGNGGRGHCFLICIACVPLCLRQTLMAQHRHDLVCRASGFR